MICFFTSMLILRYFIEDHYGLNEIPDTANITSNESTSMVENSDTMDSILYAKYFYEYVLNIVRCVIKYVVKYYEIVIVFGITLFTLMILEHITITIIVMVIGLIRSLHKFFW